ncbi:MAG: hypothetical protein K7J46_07015 [Bryobacter sp.]|nr:hypothetical protein [Bryobacter sp. CoA8 C33]
MKHWIGMMMLAGVLAGQDLAGTWQLSSRDGDGNPVNSELTLREEGGELKGVLKLRNAAMEVKRIKRDGAKVVFEIAWEDALIAVELAALEEGKLAGKWRAGDDEGAITGVKAGGDWAGVWKLMATRPNGGQTAIELEVKGDAAAFKTAEGQEIGARDLKIAGNELSVDLVLPEATVRVVLKREGGQIKGTYSLGDGTSGPIEGRR